MSARYQPGHVSKTVTYYFSVGGEKWTATLKPDHCDIQPGKHTDNADCVLKCDPGLFEKMVLKGKKPGPLDIARGKIKTSDVDLLRKLSVYFRMG
jgi:hypothetical protein